MKTLVKQVMGVILRMMPESMVSASVRAMPRLSRAVPEGKEIVMGGYLGRFRLRLDPQFNIERAILHYGYETGLCELLAREIGAGAACIDVGANIGAITFALARSAGKNGRVFAFEPGAANLTRLRRNLELNRDWDRVIRIIPKGLGEKSGMLCWRGDEANKGNGGFLTEQGAWGAEGQTAEITTLDIFAHAEELSRLDFIKIDVEGMEIEVLRGGRETIKNFRPKILLETLKDFSEIRKRDLLGEIKQFFDELEYELYRVGDNAPIKSVADFGMNTLALPRSGENVTTDAHR